MEKLVKFRDRQELQSTDLTNVGAFAQASLDHVVYDGIQHGKGWAEFTVVKSATAEATVSTGRIYSAGAVYVAETSTTFDFLSHLPLVNKRYVAIVAWGQSIETDTQPRDFLIDAMEGTTEPQAVPMQQLRKANINTVFGTEEAQPQKPIIDSANVVIAWILINPSDIESIEIVEENRLPQVARNHAAIKTLEDWRALIGARVDALASELARLNGKLSGLGQEFDVTNLAFDIARLKEIADLDDNYSAYGADHFLDEEESATDNVNYLALVEEGIRFAPEAANLTSIALFNPIEPNVRVNNGLILPHYNEALIPIVRGFNESLSISQYTFQENQLVQKSMARTRIRYGEEKTICTNNSWWKSGRFDAIRGIFYKNGDTWQVSASPKGSKYKRLKRFWTDSYTEFYWDNIVVNHTISGAQVGQTFLQPQTAWVTSIGLYFTSKGSTGAVEVMVTEVTDEGTPALKRVLAKSTLQQASIVTSESGSSVTKVPIQPTLLEAGKRYAIVLITGGNHFIAMAQGTQYAQGSFFVSVDGAYQMGTFEKDMMFSLYFAKFPVARREINLQSMSLSGGISYIDLMASMAVPDSCSLTFQVQVNGVWRSIEAIEEGNTVLHNLPALLPFRAVFTGTTDVQPGIITTDSKLYYSRPRTVFKHISDQIILDAATQSLKIVLTLENYYEVNHNCTCTIQVGGSGGEVSSAGYTDLIMQDPVDARSVNHKNIRRTFTWTATELPTAQGEIRITIDGTTSSALDTFHVAERVHVSF